LLFSVLVVLSSSSAPTNQSSLASTVPHSQWKVQLTLVCTIKSPARCPCLFTRPWKVYSFYGTREWRTRIACKCRRQRMCCERLSPREQVLYTSVSRQRVVASNPGTALRWFYLLP
ncbi:hypothetical protein B0H14DRAFT_2735368, partial [Mycena olivaceomarginata]